MKIKRCEMQNKKLVKELKAKIPRQARAAHECNECLTECEHLNTSKP